ncbi:MAG: ThiF family adenylyltransferase [Bacteroidales bacterium]
MEDWRERTELVLGKEGVNSLDKAHVLVVGLGGVGAYAAELICRAGVGEMTIVDADVVNLSNINRQLPATHQTVGKSKARLMESRLLSINPNVKLNVIEEFIRGDEISKLLDRYSYDYVVDAIDTLAPKVFLLYHAYQKGLRVVSSMGAGAKADPMQVTIADISKSYNCKLAFYVRKRLHRLGIRKGFKVVYSPERMEKKCFFLEEGEQNKLSVVGTLSYMPPVFGCHLASVVVRDLGLLVENN